MDLFVDVGVRRHRSIRKIFVRGSFSGELWLWKGVFVALKTMCDAGSRVRFEDQRIWQYQNWPTCGRPRRQIQTKSRGCRQRSGQMTSWGHGSTLWRGLRRLDGHSKFLSPNCRISTVENSVVYSFFIFWLISIVVREGYVWKSSFESLRVFVGSSVKFCSLLISLIFEMLQMERRSNFACVCFL